MSIPWFPFYVNDYTGDTMHLTREQHGSYLLLMIHYWSRGGLPKDDFALASIVKATPREWSKLRPVMAEFFDADWRHARIDIELEKAKDKSDRRAEAGARGGKAKALNASKPLANASELLQQNAKQNATVALASSSESTSITSSEVIEREARQPGKPKRAKSRTVIAPDQQPTLDDARHAHAAGMRGNDMRDEWRKFRDHHTAKGSLMADWSAAWRTWCGNFQKFRSRAGPNSGGSVLARLATEDLDFLHVAQPSEHHRAGAVPSSANQGASGFAGALPERGGDDGGGLVLDLRPAGAGR